MTSPDQSVPAEHCFKIDGVYCRLIPLTRGLFATVDASDYPQLSQHNWYAFRNGNSNKSAFYAARHSKVGGKVFTILMHREILGLDRDDPMQADHERTGETLDNRRKNLRKADQSDNNCNQRRRSNNTSGYKGVTYHIRSKAWMAQINVKKKYIFLGYRTTAEAAWRELYVPAALKYHGPFARLE